MAHQACVTVRGHESQIFQHSVQGNPQAQGQGNHQLHPVPQPLRKQVTCPLILTVFPTLCLLPSWLYSLPSSHSLVELHIGTHRHHRTFAQGYVLSSSSLCALPSAHSNISNNRDWEKQVHLGFSEFILCFQQDFKITRKSICLSCYPLVEWPLGTW